MGSVQTVKTLIKRNVISVIFPTFTILAIYADLRHTAQWKRQLAQQQDQ